VDKSPRILSQLVAPKAALPELFIRHIACTDGLYLPRPHAAARWTEARPARATRAASAAKGAEAVRQAEARAKYRNQPKGQAQREQAQTAA